MGRRRGRGIGAVACALGALALLGVTGCGVEERANEPRPQTPTRVSVTVLDDAVTVRPPRIAFGPEPTQQLPQNSEAEQPVVRSRAPLDIVFVAANLTDLNSRLRVRGPGREAISELWAANSNVSMQTALPAGVYTVSAAGIPSAEPATLVVGPRRTSSENDLLLP